MEKKGGDLRNKQKEGGRDKRRNGGGNRHNKHSRIIGIVDGIIKNRPISPSNSNELLLYANEGVVEHLKGLGTDLEMVTSRDLEEILLICSDARASTFLGLSSQLSKRTAVVFNAGNSFDSKSSMMTNIFDELIERGGKNLKIRVFGHRDCGAVGHTDNKGNVGLGILKSLLNAVNGIGEIENAKEQRDRLMTFLSSRNMGNVEVSMYYFDWNDDKVFPVGEMDETLLTFRKRFGNKLRAGCISGLEKQYAHVVGISDALSIPFTLRELFGIRRPNEMFCVTANQNPAYPFDEISFGSILYSLMNNSTNNVLLVHPKINVLHRWEGELRTLLNRLENGDNEKEKEVGVRFGNGEIVITKMVYNPKTAKVSII